MAIHRRGDDGSHPNNTSEGGAATLDDIASLPKSMLDKMLLIAKLLNRKIAGIDMIINKHTGEHHFLEANNMPQVSTGSFVGEKSKDTQYLS